jgi:predicted nucleic acid-binding protein
MLYLDSSAIVKRYFKEKGSNAVITRAAEPNQEIFTSVLSFAEVQSTIARKHREMQITSQEFTRLRESFESDWTILFTAIELNLETMGTLPKLVELYPLKAGDAIQLSTAIWLNEGIRSTPLLAPKRSSNLAWLTELWRLLRTSAGYEYSILKTKTNQKYSPHAANRELH